jgi:hypothetical protein
VRIIGSAQDQRDRPVEDGDFAGEVGRGKGRGETQGHWIWLNFGVLCMLTTSQRFLGLILFRRASSRKVAIYSLFPLLIVCSLTADASTVLVYLSPNVAVIVSDSLVNRIEGAPSRPGCKIVQVRSDMFFAATGTGVFQAPPFDPYELAREVAATNPTPAQAAKEYGRRALAPLQSIWNSSRQKYLEFMHHKFLNQPQGPQDFVFVGMDAGKNLSAAGGSFVEDDPSSRILVLDRWVEFHAQNDSDVFLGRYGIYEDMPNDVEFEQLVRKIGIVGALTHFVEIQSKAAPRLVGLPAVIVVLKRDGSSKWLSPGPCGSAGENSAAESRKPGRVPRDR